MREFTIAEVVSAVKGRLICGSGDGSVLKVCTDSRLAKPGDLFFPLIGEKNNGHDYLAQVFERGCRSVIVSEPEKIPNTYVRLDDEEQRAKMSKLLGLLEDNDDVQNVWHNWEDDE